MKLHLDFETRSEVDLQEAGAYVYARHPSTKVLCAAYAFDDGPVKFWATAAGQRTPRDLQLALERGCEVHAWNAQFERLILREVLGAVPGMEKFHCTAALARARGLPGKLETALDFLGQEVDLKVKRRGNAVMMKWCRPLPQGGYADDPAEYEELLAYCMGDVQSERSIGDRLVPLSPVEQAEYMLTEVINDRGLPIDRELALAAQGYGDEEKRELSALLAWMTGGQITTVNQHARIKGWLAAKLGMEVFATFFIKAGKPSTDKNARLDFLNSEAAKEADPDVVDLIEVIDDAGKASVSKYARMAARATDNGRAEGSYLCWGAAQTKRYSSRGVQVHNLLRKGPDDLQGAIDAVLAHTVQGKVMHVLASLMRPTIKAPKGKVLVWGDWAAVEARGMPWLAGCEWKLNLYRQGVDVYRVNARDIFSVPAAEASEGQRQIGKVAELSLQFGGAVGALRAMARGYGISLTEGRAGNIVMAWRSANGWAMTFSQGLYDAFLRCAVTDSPHACGRVIYRQITPLLHGTVSIECLLPGGTTIYYHGVRGKVGLYRKYGQTWEVEVGSGDPVGGLRIDGRETEVIFTKTLPGGFRIERLWHGLLAENVTQALCAALLRDCLDRVERKLNRRRFTAIGRIEVIGHTHDEIILECDAEVADAAAGLLSTEMRRVPKWLDGFPLDCSVTSAQRYGK